jgi:hypothetical protein
MTKRPTDMERLSKFSEALDESIIEASEKDLREEFAEAGDDFDKAVTRVGSTIERAKAAAGRVRLERAKREMKSFHEQQDVRPVDLAKARRRLADMRAGDPNDTMMAARKGGRLSERDEEGVLKDLAQLDVLEEEAERDEGGEGHE